MKNVRTPPEDEDYRAHSAYARALGAKLRELRCWRRLSLKEVEIMSGRTFDSETLGSYERGERTISLSRLQGMAKLYYVPIDFLLP